MIITKKEKRKRERELETRNKVLKMNKELTLKIYTCPTNTHYIYKTPKHTMEEKKLFAYLRVNITSFPKVRNQAGLTFLLKNI